MNYLIFFRTATCTDNNQNGFDPMGWQCRLACGETADPQKSETLEGGVEIALRTRYLLRLATMYARNSALICV